jgi:hypothetical protein
MSESCGVAKNEKEIIMNENKKKNNNNNNYNNQRGRREGVYCRSRRLTRITRSPGFAS